MATEASQAEVPAPPPPSATGASPQKRALPVPGDGGEEHPPEPKRRRACVAALDGVACAATAASGPGSGSDCDASFSFQHAGGRFVALETTPKFGSFNFNSPAAAEQAGVEDLKPAATDGEGLPEADEQVAASSSSSSGAKEDGYKEENAHSHPVGVETGGDHQGHTDKNDDTVPTC